MKKESHYRNELLCGHGIGHGPHIHNCDGCCAPLVHIAEDAEQARIIKLLEEHPVTISYDAPDCFGCFTSNSYNSHLLALIKGKAE